MPMYIYERIDTEGDEQPQQVEVLRKFDDYETPPTDDEYPDASQYKWRRVLGGKQNIQRPWGWKKGHW